MTKTLQYMRKRHYTIRIRDTRVDTSGASAPRDTPRGSMIGRKSMLREKSVHEWGGGGGVGEGCGGG